MVFKAQMTSISASPAATAALLGSLVEAVEAFTIVLCTVV
jgi:hypothetical protein